MNKKSLQEDFYKRKHADSTQLSSKDSRFPTFYLRTAGNIYKKKKRLEALSFRLFIQIITATFYKVKYVLTNVRDMVCCSFQKPAHE